MTKYVINKGKGTGMQFIENKTDIRIINECIALLRSPKSESEQSQQTTTRAKAQLRLVSTAR